MHTLSLILFFQSFVNLRVLQTLPPTIFKGLPQSSTFTDFAEEFDIDTVLKFSKWKHYLTAKYIKQGSLVEGTRDSSSEMNIDEIIASPYNLETFADMLSVDVADAMPELASWNTSVLLNMFDVVTIGDLANLDFGKWSELIVTFAPFN
eukprot:m.51997 g.51997  ORF g.51997 m.51997 type:complete len:149 (+) comp7595_c0_seq1:100-546(+)